MATAPGSTLFTNNANPDLVHGWVLSPDERGTIDIIYSSILVLVSAIWTLLHLNLAARDDTLWQITKRKMRWGTVAIFAPDLLTMIAAAQWDAARQSLHQMQEIIGKESKSWTMVHAFYANAGGFVLVTRDGATFPLTAAGVHYLVKRGLIPIPTIPRDEIWDKSKADMFAKLAALIQCGWMVLQCIGRVVEGLSVSPLELFTVAFVVSTALTYYFWMLKPQDVGTPTIINCPLSLDEILKDAGLPPGTDYEHTPLDFVDRSTRNWQRRSIFKNFDLERGPERPKDPNVVEEATDAEKRSCEEIGRRTGMPIQRIPDDSILPSRLPAKVLIGVVMPSMIHSCIHLLGWNLEYPTSFEQLLWRISAVTLAVMSCLSVGAIRVLGVMGYQGKFNLVWVWVNSSWVRNKEKRRIMWWDIMLSFTMFSLVVARLFIIVEVCLSLRALPKDAFLSVNWSIYIPHV